MTCSTSFSASIVGLNKISWTHVRQRAESTNQMAMKPLYWRSVNCKDAGWPHLTHHHRGGWNEMNGMILNKWWIQICGMGKQEESRQKPIQTPFFHHETHMEWTRRELETPALGGESLTACATEPFCSYSLQGNLQELDLRPFYRLQPHDDLKRRASKREISLLFCTPSVWKPHLCLRILIWRKFVVEIEGESLGEEIENHNTVKVGCQEDIRSINPNITEKLVK